jgi:hypothetical protein
VGPKFNIHTNKAFERVKLVVNETINKSIDASLGTGISQSNVFSLSKERLMLNQVKCQITSPQGVNLCFGYFCMLNFVIHKAQELKNVNDIDLSLHVDDFGQYLKFFLI